jgi:hypothetical protein
MAPFLDLGDREAIGFQTGFKPGMRGSHRFDSALQYLGVTL